MSKPFDRVILIILDGLGVGELPDADQYGDVGSDTLGHIAQAVGGLHLPNLERLGLGRVGKFKGLKSAGHRMGAYGRMAECSKGKDTTTGHWEMMGIVLEKPFPVYPKGFPPEIIEPFKKAIGRDILGNVPASGTEIIKELGERHLATGYPILYTSADSVFQIAAHEEVIPVDALYHMCRIARKILVSPHNVSRVIARPFVGRPGQFTRTERRRDFSVEPPQETLLDRLCQHGIPVIGIGKIEDIFAAKGITRAIHTRNDMDGVDQTLKIMSEVDHGLIFTNLVDFDTLYGHRNDVQGYARNLREFDLRIPDLLHALRERDLLILSADHGNDPTTPSTDHSREYVPLLVYSPLIQRAVDLGTRGTFADLGQTLTEVFGVEKLSAGTSFLSDLVYVKRGSGFANPSAGARGASEDPAPSSPQGPPDSIEKKLRELGITLPSPPKPVGSYIPAVRTGNLLFLSGMIPFQDGKLAWEGKLGRELTVEQGKQAARLALINALAVIQQALGSLDHVNRIVRLGGHVASVPGFNQQPLVLNGASDLLVEIFGEKGRHARLALGAVELPLNAPVELELIVEVEGG